MSISYSTLKDVQMSRHLALIAAFTALVFLSTSIFTVELPTTGYFNLGESFVYLAALIGGPIVGGIAGGFGASLADEFLGYGSFAPATLVLKGLEGFTVGLLFNFRDVDQTRRRRFLIGISIFIILFAIYLSIANGSFTIAKMERYTIEGVILPAFLLLFLALITTALIWLVEYKTKQQGRMALSCIIAGPIIIIGYFLYEIIFLKIALETALIEVPFNIAQVIFGTLIAVPIVSYLDDLGILPERKTYDTDFSKDEHV